MVSGDLKHSRDLLMRQLNPFIGTEPVLKGPSTVCGK